jgi:hypothetical protein
MVILKVIFCVLLCLPLAYVVRFLIVKLVEVANSNN